MSPPTLIDAPSTVTEAPVALSYELFPPRSDAASVTLWKTIRELEGTAPDYVSVTYGASGSNHDTALDLVDRLQLETTLRPLAHLTCVGGTPEELSTTVNELLDRGVRGILALRGDKPRDGQVPAGSLRYAQDLIELIRRVELRRSAQFAAGKVAIGVAAYPTKHPESPSEAHDIEVLLAKQRSGADFAITQVFFHAEQYASLIHRARRAGVTIPIIPGIMPLTSLRRILKLSELSGVAPDATLVDRMRAAGDDGALARKIGVEASVALAQAALDAGAPGLHLYTFNEHESALEVLARLDLPRPSRPSLARRQAN
ncbi:methylenetetrahydrofolate reductase [Sinomonas sp. JGH33]|uniref:Methylenetetrahydrofolate reductase n=1 Tax=Sinomonas terricola TaxID=3110330 RepID=A0ABU5T7C9_9MICC|nr:methylenetetrahydrofolate reductase [Sinomonas sp. JGH33]MEA5455450.1 methylenetetrahydrofolate reductase [Sinomonas sp. JGH33]